MRRRVLRRLLAGGIACVFAVLLGACAVVKSQPVGRVALFAPFEGRYREVGYNALYAARLAFADAGNPAFELFAVDDGGTLQRAVDRARALALDPSIVAAVILGYDASAETTLDALGDIPALIVGNWADQESSPTRYWLSNPGINASLTTAPYPSVTEAAATETPLVGGDVFALQGFRELHNALEGVTVLSSGNLPDEAFAERYRASDPFAPEPGLLTSLTYDAFRLVLADAQHDRASMNDRIRLTSYEGLNGVFTLAQGYWQEAPLHQFRYVNGQLTAADHVVE